MNSGRYVARSWLVIGRRIRDVKCDYYYVQATTRCTVGIFIYIFIRSEKNITIKKQHFTGKTRKKSSKYIELYQWRIL